MSEHTTNAIPAVYEAIARVSAELATMGIGKLRKSQQQGFAYRGIDDVYQVLAALLPKHGLVILPRVLSRTVTERTSRTGQPLFSVLLDVEYDLVATEDGSSHTVRIPGEAMDSGDKGTNKSLSSAYKYMAIQVFCVPVEGVMLDPDEETHELARVEAKAPKAQEEELPKSRRGGGVKSAGRQVSPKPAAAGRPIADDDDPPVVEHVNPNESVNLDKPIEARLYDWVKSISAAPNMQELRTLFAQSYTWASEIVDARQRTFVLLKITEAKDVRKEELTTPPQPEGE